MYATLFKNKWPALAFVVLVLAGTQYFVGNWGEEFVPADAPTSPMGQGDDGDEFMVKSSPPTEMSPDQEAFYDDDPSFLSDEELIDGAEGFDPTPVEDVSFLEDDFASDPDVDDTEQEDGLPVPLGNADSGIESAEPDPF